MAKKKLSSIVDLIDLAGNTTKLAASLEITAHTVEKWKINGIPIKYWDALIEEYAVTADELLNITRNCKR